MPPSDSVCFRLASPSNGAPVVTHVRRSGSSAACGRAPEDMRNQPPIYVSTPRYGVGDMGCVDRFKRRFPGPIPAPVARLCPVFAVAAFRPGNFKPHVPIMIYGWLLFCQIDTLLPAEAVHFYENDVQNFCLRGWFPFLPAPFCFRAYFSVILYYQFCQSR